MAILQRLSDSFWSYVSPAKQNATRTTPQTLPRFKKPAIPPRRGSLQDIRRHSRSMSPEERVDSWRVGSSSQASSSVTNKRKRPITPSTGVGRRRKIIKVDDEELNFTPDVDDESDVIEEDEKDEEEWDEESSNSSNINVARSSSSKPPSSTRPSPKGYQYADSSISVDETLVLPPEEYQRRTPKKKKLISPTTEHFSHGVSTSELRAAGWDDDHIHLVQKLALRGFEPLMPAHWKFDYRFMPDALFSATDDDAHVRSVRGDHYRGILALEKLLELGGRVRDRVFLKGRVKPEEQTRRMLSAYIKWAEEDSGLDKKTAIPILALETKPAATPATELQANARRKLARLATRYRDAFRISQSIESSPASGSSLRQLTYPVPTLYAFIASHTLVALVAYNPDEAEPEPEIRSVAFFDMKDPDYDVWNVLALAIIVCHVGDVQVRIAGETGLGLKGVGGDGEEGMEGDDPDV